MPQGFQDALIVISRLQSGSFHDYNPGMWQEIITYVIVAGAAVYLVFGIVRSFRGEAGSCGGNCACDAVKKPAANLGTRRELVQVGIEHGKGDA